MIDNILKTDYIAQYGNDWPEDYPDHCPPEDVSVSNGDLFYRLTINATKITDYDWKSYHELYPNKHFTGEKLVMSFGLSLLDNIDIARSKLLPVIRNKYHGVAEISLDPTDGVIKKTGRFENHYTWWKTNSCDLSKAHLV